MNLPGVKHLHLIMRDLGRGRPSLDICLCFCVVEELSW